MQKRLVGPGRRDDDVRAVQCAPKIVGWLDIDTEARTVASGKDLSTIICRVVDAYGRGRADHLERFELQVALRAFPDNRHLPGIGACQHICTNRPRETRAYSSQVGGFQDRQCRARLQIAKHDDALNGRHAPRTLCVNLYGVGGNPGYNTRHKHDGA
jgi:hypothetical protein